MEGARERGVTLSDVAEAAGVSQPTASRVLNGSGRRVGPGYRERVMSAARELGYLPTASTQAVARGTAPLLSLVVTSVTGHYFSMLAGAMMSAAGAAGLEMSVSVTARDRRRELAIVRELRDDRPRAIVFAGADRRGDSDQQPLIDELWRYEALGGKVLQVGRSDLPFDAIDLDGAAAARQLAIALTERGYRRALVIDVDLPLTALRARADGFRDGFGGTVETVRTPVDWTSVRRVVERIGHERLAAFDLIFSITDEGALGALRALRSHGLRVPEDLGVAGFNDLPGLREITPPLTTIHVPLHALAHEVVRRACAAPGDHPGSADAADLSLLPVLRASTPPR